MFSDICVKISLLSHKSCKQKGAFCHHSQEVKSSVNEWQIADMPYIILTGTKAHKEYVRYDVHGKISSEE
jgi:hypothetical protein